MKTLDKGKDKIKKICEVLRDEALEPAKIESEEIIKNAHKQAAQIIEDAKARAEELLESSKNAIEREQNVFQSTLQQAAKQSLSLLKQQIEHHFFNDNLANIIDKGTADPQLIASLINAIVKALDKEGMAADLSGLIPKHISEKKVNELLLHDVVTKLRGKSLEIGDFSGGACVRLNDKRLVIDISDLALKELLSGHIVRKDFRKLVFET